MSTATDITKLTTSDQIISILMDHEEAQGVFRRYCERTFNADSFLFLQHYRSYLHALECDGDGGGTTITEDRLEQLIYDMIRDFLVDESPHELNLDAQLRHRTELAFQAWKDQREANLASLLSKPVSPSLKKQTSFAEQLFGAIHVPNSGFSLEEANQPVDPREHKRTAIHKMLREVHFQIQSQVALDIIPRFLRDPTWLQLDQRQNVVAQVAALRRQRAINRVRITPDIYHTICVSDREFELFDYLQEDSDDWLVVKADNRQQVFVGRPTLAVAQDMEMPFASFKHVTYFEKPMWLVWLAYCSLHSLYGSNKQQLRYYGLISQHWRGSPDPDDPKRKLPHAVDICASKINIAPLLTNRGAIYCASHRWSGEQQRLFSLARQADLQHSNYVRSVAYEKAKFPRKNIVDMASSTSTYFQQIGEKTRFSMVFVANMGGWLRNAKIGMKSFVVKRQTGFESTLHSIMDMIEKNPIEFCAKTPSIRVALENLHNNTAHLGLPESKQPPKELFDILRSLRESSPEIPLEQFQAKDLKRFVQEF